MLGSSIRATPSNTMVTTQARDVPDDIVFSLGDGKDQALLNRSTTLNTNTALANVLIGTPVTPALPSNSLIISNITTDGDVVIAANDGGTSYAGFYMDGSAGTTDIRAKGAINFMASSDVDDYLTITTAADVVTLTATGGSSFNFVGAAEFDAITTAGLVTMVASDVPQSLIEDSAGAGVAGYRMVGAHTFASDNNLEAFITVTVPNNYMDGVIKILYQIHGNGTAKSMHSGEIFVDITRSNGANTGMSILQSIADQTITSGGTPDTMTVTFSVSALTGASGATQTFNVECTVDNSDNGISYLKYRAELLTSMYTGGAGTKMSMVSV